jgi:excisionase family DNA binding protein
MNNSMNDLLTTRQVKELLKVDRITIYRMLQDGRLKGVKIGQQWRFHLNEVERIVGLNMPVVESTPANSDSTFPAHCVQTIQNLFAEVSQISAVVIDMQGNPLTQISHSTDFCQMLLSTTSGTNAFRASWQSFARDSAAVNGVLGSKFFTCHAGLHYIGAPIFDKDEQIGLFLAGQFYWQSPDPREESERIRRLAAAHNLSLKDLQGAARNIPVIDPDQHAQVESWPFTAAQAVQSILHERITFIDRLQKIANLTQL